MLRVPQVLFAAKQAAAVAASAAAHAPRAALRALEAGELRIRCKSPHEETFAESILVVSWWRSRFWKLCIQARNLRRKTTQAPTHLILAVIDHLAFER